MRGAANRTSAIVACQGERIFEVVEVVRRDWTRAARAACRARIPLPHGGRGLLFWDVTTARTLLGIAAGTLTWAVSGVATALAQSVVQPLALRQPQPLPAGDEVSGDIGALSGYRALAPLRLSLEASIDPKGGGFPNCISREDAAGNSVGGIPVQHWMMLRLTPRLVLSGFTQLGCPIDAGLGGALTYALPITRSSWLVFGGGLYAAPGQAQLFGEAPMLTAFRAPFPLSTAGRVDFGWKTNGDHTFNLGVQTLSSRGRGVQSVMFGGGF
jgi:hypothetical protein